MKWVNTTLRKGTKTPKICRDMFLTDSKGKFGLLVAKNGRLVSREQLTIGVFLKIVKDNRLIGRGTCFMGCFTYRTEDGWRVVDDALSRQHKEQAQC